MQGRPAAMRPASRWLAVGNRWYAGTVDGLGDVLAQIRFPDGFHLLEYHRADLSWRKGSTSTLTQASPFSAETIPREPAFRMFCLRIFEASPIV